MISIFICVIAFAQSTRAQTDSIYFDRWGYASYTTDVVIGYSGQLNSRGKGQTLEYFEVGIGKTRHLQTRHGPVSAGVTLSEEIYLGQHGLPNVYGTKLGVWTHYLFDIGFSTILYTDFKQVSYKLRPELGMGVGWLRLHVGYNFPTIGNRCFELLRRQNLQLSAQLCVPVRRKRVNNPPALFKDWL